VYLFVCVEISIYKIPHAELGVRTRTLNIGIVLSPKFLWIIKYYI